MNIISLLNSITLIVLNIGVLVVIFLGKDIFEILLLAIFVIMAYNSFILSKNYNIDNK